MTAQLPQCSPMNFQTFSNAPDFVLKKSIHKRNKQQATRQTHLALLSRAASCTYYLDERHGKTKKERTKERIMWTISLGDPRTKIFALDSTLELVLALCDISGRRYF